MSNKGIGCFWEEGAMMRQGDWLAMMVGVVRSAICLEDGRFQDSLFNDIPALGMCENAEVNRLGAH